MKKLFMVTDGAQFRRIWGSAFVIVAGILFSFSFWMAGPIATAQTPTPAATPDYLGANDPKKVTICHVPPGNHNNPQTITIGSSAVSAHMRNHSGDCLGPCPCNP